MTVRCGTCYFCGNALVGCAGHYTCGQCAFSYGQFGIDQTTTWFGPSLETLEQEERDRQQARARWRRELFRDTCERRKESLQLKHNAQLVEVGRAVLAEMGLNQ